MFRFENPDHLYALVAIPVLIACFVLLWLARKRLLAKFGEASLIRQLMPHQSRYKHGIKFSLVLLALAFLIVGWANPQWGSKREKVKRKSVDVFLAMDISYSMLAMDILPNRLDRARQFASKLADELKGERIGLILFAGNAYLQTPLTTDYAAVELFIRSANPNLAPTQGTAIGDAIDLAEQSFEEDNKHHKVMVILSDGENHDEEALQRAIKARGDGLLIFTIGVGTEDGGFIPISQGARSDFKRDRSGNPVRSRIDEGMLREVAQEGGGAYYNLTQGDQVIEVIRDRINGMEKKEFEQRSFSEYESYFQYFIGAGLLFLLLEFLLSYRKSKWWGDRDLFKAK